MKSSLVFALLALGLLLPQVYATSSSSSIEVNGKTHVVNYVATNLTVEDFEADTTTATLSVLVSTKDSPGTLEITLDRDFFDSKTDGTDDDFLVITGVEEAVFEEKRNDASRILTITVPPGTNSIDIISVGTRNFPAETKTTEEPVKESDQSEQITEEPPEEASPESTAQCGPGTILKDGVCVVEMSEPDTTEQVTEEPPIVKETQQDEPTIPTKEEAVTQCGPGTILKDGVCALDETCGPGTILKEGQCVLDDSSTQSAIPKGQGTQLIFAIVAAFIVAMIIMIILWAIGRAGRQKN